MTSWISAGFAFILLCCSGAQAQQKAVNIRVDYAFTSVRVSTGQRNTMPVEWSVGATLSGNRVTDSWEGKVAGTRSAGGGTGALGGKWRVVGPNELMRVTNWPNSQTIVYVTVSGQTCVARVEARLNPGKRVYLLRSVTDGSLTEYTDPRYTDVRCSIGES